MNDAPAADNSCPAIKQNKKKKHANFDANKTLLLLNPFALAEPSKRVKPSDKVDKKLERPVGPITFIRNAISSQTGFWSVTSTLPKSKRPRNTKKKLRGTSLTDDKERTHLEVNNVTSSRNDPVLLNCNRNQCSKVDDSLGMSRMNSFNALSVVGRKWIYVSGFPNTTTARAVQDYVCQKLRRDDIQCAMLLSRGVDLLSRRKLAFKV